MRTRTILAVSAFALIFTMLGGLVSAHHAVVGFERDRSVTLKGVVAEWRWRAPHSFLLVDVKDDSGKVVRWSGELLSPISMTAAGLSKTSFKAGDPVTMIGRPASNGTPHSVIQRILNAEGKILLDRANPLEP